MENSYSIKVDKFSKKLLFNILAFALLVYFICHSIYGNRGILAYFKLNQQITKSASELDKLRAERVAIQHKVKLLRPESLDKDMLDETVRNILGVAGENEKVFTVSNEVGD